MIYHEEIEGEDNAIEVVKILFNLGIPFAYYPQCNRQNVHDFAVDEVHKPTLRRSIQHARQFSESNDGEFQAA